MKSQTNGSLEHKWVDEKKVSMITGLSLSTLQKHRFNRVGISYFKVGKSVRYDLHDVEAFMKERRIAL